MRRLVDDEDDAATDDVPDLVEMMAASGDERPLVRRPTAHAKRRGKYKLTSLDDCAELGVDHRGKMPTGNPVLARMGRPDTWRR